MEMQIIILRLLLTFFLAVLFGLESQRSHKPVGFGTFAFVAIGSCVLSLVALEVGEVTNLALVGSIISGIGFLGAGALIKTSDKVFGFMTAASVWLFSILGIIIGYGYYSLGAIVYSFMWFCVMTDMYLEKKGIGGYQKKISVRIKGEENEKELDLLFRKFKIKKHYLISKEVDKIEKILKINYIIEAPGSDIRRLAQEFQKNPNFLGFSLS